MILPRYLDRVVRRPFAPALCMFIAIFASYTVATSVSDAANALMPAATIAAMVGLRVVISLEVLIPTALYLSVLLSMQQLQRDQEHIALSTLRLGPSAVLAAVFRLSASLALVVALLSLAVRPWAYRTLHEVGDRAAAAINLDAMQAGTFYSSRHGERVVFLGDRRGPGSPARDVFIRIPFGDHTRIVHAGGATLLPRPDPATGSQVYLTDAHVYDLAGPDNRDDQVLDASGMVMDAKDGVAARPGYSSAATGTLSLARSRAAYDEAELQWRLSTPLSTLLLGLLGVAMSRPGARRNWYARPILAVLAYLGYQMLFSSARVWLQHGVVGRMPGLWWVPALLAGCLAIAWVRHTRHPELADGRA